MPIFGVNIECVHLHIAESLIMGLKAACFISKTWHHLEIAVHESGCLVNSLFFLACKNNFYLSFAVISCTKLLARCSPSTKAVTEGDGASIPKEKQSFESFLCLASPLRIFWHARVVFQRNPAVYVWGKLSRVSKQDQQSVSMEPSETALSAINSCLWKIHKAKKPFLDALWSRAPWPLIRFYDLVRLRFFPIKTEGCMTPSL